MSNVISRPFAPADRDACLAVFDSNTPRFFAPEERGEFEGFLGNIEACEGRYLVLTRGASVIACGGLSFNPAGTQASLSWGMVNRAHHGQGLGSRLTRERIALARQVTGISELVLSTSQHSRGFYEAFGFGVVKITQSGLGTGLDRYDMALMVA